MSSDVAEEYFSQWGTNVTPLGMPLHVALLAQGYERKTPWLESNDEHEWRSSATSL